MIFVGVFLGLFFLSFGALHLAVREPKATRKKKVKAALDNVLFVKEINDNMGHPETQAWLREQRDLILANELPEMKEVRDAASVQQEAVRPVREAVSANGTSFQELWEASVQERNQLIFLGKAVNDCEVCTSCNSTEHRRDTYLLSGEAYCRPCFYARLGDELHARSRDRAPDLSGLGTTYAEARHSLEELQRVVNRSSPFDWID